MKVKTSAPAKRIIHAEQFFRKLPELAIAGDEQSVDRIAYELLNLLMKAVDADIGQISLFPLGGRVEKMCIVKDGEPWLRTDKDLHLYNPSKGYAGRMLATGETLLVKDIWTEPNGNGPNPFLEIYPYMDANYVADIKKPVASTLFLPIKRGIEVFCVIELSRYRHKPSFTQDEQAPLDEFAAQYGTLIINYILDTKNRIALNTVHHKLNILSRLIASDAKVDYTDAVSVYRTMSAADLGFAFFRRGSGYDKHALRIVAWYGEETMEVYFPEFQPSSDSLLCDRSEISYPFEGDSTCRRLHRFRERINSASVIKRKEQKFLLKVIDSIRSYVVYPLHMLGQDLGSVHLASSRNDFCKFLQMSPFLSLYNSLLKSFLLNERVAELLSEISLKIHNPGFYCLAGLKSALLQENPALLNHPKINTALSGLDALLSDLHEKGKILKCRDRNIDLKQWLAAYVNQISSRQPDIEINFEVKDVSPGRYQVRANYEQLETVFENLFSNSIRALNERRHHGSAPAGRIDIILREQRKASVVCFQDNGMPYKTVSGRGTPQMKQIMKELGGKFRKYDRPYRVYLTFPHLNVADTEK
ncbi:MAG: hypothetical protein RBT11_01560 [Desulfobacterales bacterium]|jgi:hypothetical protein|nr:hypothetical protein [Desulfobacterales bacterium]